MALEAARVVAGGQEVELFEIRDLVIGKAIAFEDDPSFGVETIVTLSGITPLKEQGGTQFADFSCHAGARNGSASLDLVSSGSLMIVYGTPCPHTLTSVPLERSIMNDIDADEFYASIAKIGYGYSGPFRGMSSIRRKMDQASALVSTYKDSAEDDVLVHPSWLDVAIQTVIAAGAHPEDENKTLAVPTVIGRIRVNPSLCAALPTSSVMLPMCASIHRTQMEGKNSSASIDIFSEDGQQTLIQAEDLEMKPLYAAAAKDDRRPFSYVQWQVAQPDTSFIASDERPPATDRDIAVLCERMSYFYLRKWKAELSDDEWARGQEHHHRLQGYMNSTLLSISRGEHPILKDEWANDTSEILEPLIQKHWDSVDVRVVRNTGENLPAVVRGETTMVEHLNEDRTDLYTTGIGFAKYSEYAASMVKQLVHRYPHARILELGAGTGGTTVEVLRAVGNAFSSYAFTDISDSFLDDLERIKGQFKSQSHKISYKYLDIGKSPASQGFDLHSYDIVVAANIVHATPSCQQSLENTWKLLKPGGFIVLAEITQTNVLRYPQMAAGLPGWWSAQDGRENGPLLSSGSWHNLLRKSGFSGVDALTPPIDNLTWPFSAMTGQAVNKQVDFLRRPLAAPLPSLHFDEVVILGTGSVETAKIADELEELLARFCDKVTIFDGLPATSDELPPMSTIISLVDLDEPVYKNISQAKWDGLHKVYRSSKNLLWVTNGAQDVDPYQMASIGVGRALRYEVPYLTLTSLDLAGSNHNVSKVIAECLLRQCALDELPSSDSNLLWSVEHEYVLENGRLMVPRMLANKDQNDRFNAQVRPITKTVSPSDSAIRISEKGELQEDILPAPEECQDVIRVEQSVMTPLNVAPNTFLYASVGVNDITGERLLALSNDMSSRVKPVVAIPLKSSEQALDVFVSVLGELLAASILSAAPAGSHILIHELVMIPHLLETLDRRAAERKVRLAFSTASSGGDPANLGSIAVNAWTPKHALQKLLPAGITHFLDLTTDSESNAASIGLGRALPLSCRHIDTSDLFRRNCHLPVCVETDLVSFLRGCASHAEVSNDHLDVPAGLLVPLARISQAKEPLTIVDWTANEDVTIQITPINPARLFSKNKTYILVGLTGEIGQSLCEWMARNGAGCIVLTSRSPNVSEHWLKSFEALGTTVKVVAM